MWGEALPYHDRHPGKPARTPCPCLALAVDWPHASSRDIQVECVTAEKKGLAMEVEVPGSSQSHV